MALSALIGALRVNLGLNSAEFKKGATAAERQMRSLQTSLRRAAKDMQGIGRSMSLAITLPLGAAGATMLRTAGGFEASMNRVRAALGSSDAEFAALAAAAREMGRNTQFSASEAAAAIEMLARNGLDAAQILDGALASSLTLAAAGSTDLATASDMATDVMGQFGFAASEMASVVDAMAGTMLASKFGIEDYGLALAQAGGVAGGLGVEFGDFNAALAATSSLFASGSDAGTALKTFLQRLATQSGAAAAAVEDLGLSFFDADGNIRSMSEIAQELQDSLSGLSEEARSEALTTIFGTDAMRTAIGLMQAGGNELDRLAEKIGEVSAADQAAARMEGLNGALARMRSAMQELYLTIADTGALDAVTGLVERITGMLGALSEVNPQLVRTGVILASVAAAAGPLAIAFGAVASAGSQLLGLLRLIVPVIVGMTGPIGAAVAGLGLLAGAFVILSTRSVSAETALDRTNAAADRFTQAMAGVEQADSQIAAAKDQMAAASTRYRAAVASEADQAAATALIEVQSINERIGALERLREKRLAAARVAALEANAAFEQAQAAIRREVAGDVSVAYPRGRAGIGAWDERLAEYEAALEDAVNRRMTDIRQRLARGEALSDTELGYAAVGAAAGLAAARVDLLNKGVASADDGPLRKLAASTADVADGAEDAVDQVGDVLDGLERTGDRVLDLRSGIAALRDAIGDGTLSGAAADAAREAIAGMENELARLEGIGRGAGEGVSGGVAKGIAASADQPVAALQSLGQRLAGIAGQMGTGVVSAITQGLMSGDFSAAAGGLASTLQSGLGSALGSVFSEVFTSAGGLGSAISSIATSFKALNVGLNFAGTAAAAGNAGAALANLGSALSAGLPAIGAAVAGIQVLSSLAGSFSTKSVKDGGVALSVTDGQLDGGSYQTVRRSTAWGLKRSTRDQWSALDGDIEAAISQSIAGIKASVASSYEALGMSVSDSVIDAFSVAEQKLSFKDKSEAEIQAMFEAWLDQYGEGLSVAVGGLSREAAQTAATVSSVLEPVGAALRGSLWDVATAAADLSGLAGGVDALSQMASVYRAAFYTEAQITAQTSAALAEAFSGLGLAMPTTAAGFRGLVEAQDLATEGGRETYVALLSLSSAFASVTGTAQEAQEAQAAAAAAAQVAAEEAQAAAAAAAARAAAEAQAAAELAAANAEAADAVQGALADIGRTASDAVALGLAAAAGGAEEFARTADRYWSAAYTEAERTATLSEQLAAALAEIGLVMPQTIGGFRALVDAQNLATTTGREAYAALLGLADAASEVFGTADDMSRSLAIDDTYFVTEFDARMAALAAQNGFTVEQAVGAGTNAYGAASLSLDNQQVGLLRRMVAVFEDWENTGLPQARAF